MTALQKIEADLKDALELAKLSVDAFKELKAENEKLRAALRDARSFIIDVMRGENTDDAEERVNQIGDALGEPKTAPRP